MAEGFEGKEAVACRGILKSIYVELIANALELAFACFLCVA